MKTQARIRLFHSYIYISIAVVSFFTAFFAWNQYWPAAFLQGAFLVPFLIAPTLFNRGHQTFSKWLTILASCSVVLLQTNHIFTNATGFHFQLIALIVVAFLICDLKKQSEIWLSIVFACIIIIFFFFSESMQFAGPVIVVSDRINLIFRYMSFTTTLTALSFLLFYYSKLLANKEIELSQLANFDALTKIHNRGFFMREGERLYQMTYTKRQPISAILFDIDDFKRINDDYGHPVGDKVLIGLAKTVSSQISPDIVFSRYGGEEFGLLLPNSTLNEAYVLAEQIRTTIEKLSITSDTHQISCTISVGVASSFNASESFDALMIAADRALYYAKRNGKNQSIAECGDTNSCTINCIQ